MLSKTTLLPIPKFKTIGEAQKWAEDFCSFFQKFYSELYNEFNESTKISVKGKDGYSVHGFFGSKNDM